MEGKEIKALISLLDENDEEIRAHVREKVLSLGTQALPYLDMMSEDVSTSSSIIKSITPIINKIKVDSIAAELKNWTRNEELDLLDGVFIVNSLKYANLDTIAIRDTLETIKHDIWLELSDRLTAFEKVKVLNHFFFNEQKFSPNRKDYHSEDNSMINKVVENRTGNPLTLSILYLHIARRLDMPVFGINLPNHFLLAWVIEPDENNPWAEEDGEKPEVLFYINPFSEGAILQKEGIDSFLSHNGVIRDESFYMPCDELAIVRRMLNNLKNSYTKTGHEEEAGNIDQLLAIFTKKLVEK